MIYPRLKLARNLLTDEGVIFISIDDNEQNNLKKICDEIFGESNFICQFTRKGSGGRQDSTFFAIIHEYILCYAKNSNRYISGKEIKEGVNYPFYDEEKKRKYKTQLLRKWGENSRRNDRPNLFFAISDPDGNEHFPMLSEKEEGCWRWGKERMFNEIEKNNVEFKKKGEKWIAYEKIYEPTADNPDTKLYTTIIDDISNSTGTSLLKQIFKNKIFDYPKPVDLIVRILKYGNTENGIILDFFSGSSTTAHASLKLNSEDNGKRKFIMVQLPEGTDEKSDAYKAGYKTISEIAKERIRRAGDEILSESNNKNLDIGFKVFKLDSSNLNKWNPDYNNVEQTVLDSQDNLVSGRTELDLVYEIMLKYGIDLTLPIEEHEIINKKIYSIGFGALLICLDDNITKEIAIPLIELKNKLSPETSRVVFKDNGFASDSDKTNIKETLKTNNLDEFITI